jgi:hypothetical protein
MKHLTAIVIVLLSVSRVARANHGPGTSGGGSSTISGETLKPGQFSLDLRFDYTEFEHVSRAEAERRAIESGGFDALRRSFVYTGTLSYGILDDLQVSATIGYYHGEGFIDAEPSEDEPGEAESGIADPEALTDLFLNVKYRLLRGRPGNLAIVGGVKFPTGRDDVRLNNGESLEPSSQPGTGAYDCQFGLAYSRFLTSHLTMDASGLYTLRTRHDGFKVGDRFDAGLALAYRLTESIRSFPQWSVFGEANYIWLGKDDAGGEEGINNNSGGNTLYLTPGMRVRFNESASLTVAPSFPVWQDLNGDQIESQFKLAVTLSFTF